MTDLSPHAAQLLDWLRDRIDSNLPSPGDSQIAKRFGYDAMRLIRELEAAGEIAVERTSHGRQLWPVQPWPRRLGRGTAVRAMSVTPPDPILFPTPRPDAPPPPPVIEEPVMTEPAPAPPELSKADILYDMLCDRAAQNWPAPTNAAIAKLLHVTDGSFWLRKLQEDDRISVELNGNRRTVTIAATGQVLRPEHASPPRPDTKPAAIRGRSAATVVVDEYFDAPRLNPVARVELVDGQLRLVFGLGAGGALHQLMSSPIDEDAATDLLTSAAIALRQVRNLHQASAGGEFDRAAVRQ